MTDHKFRRMVCCNCSGTFDVPINCGDRFCGICNRNSRQRAADRIRSIIAQTPRIERHRWKMATFTIPNQPDPTEAVETVLRQFRRLRQRKWWKQHVWGGIYAIEITNTGKMWHAHIHALVYSVFMPQHMLAAQWKACGPGRIVDIRAANSNALLSYITKYITKNAVNEDLRPLLAKALSGKRLYSPFGAAHAINATTVKVPYHCEHCQGTCFMPLDVVESFIRRTG